MTERIMAYGGFGGGKSTLYMSLIESLPDSMFYIFDTDYAIERNVPDKYRHQVKFVQGDEIVDLVRQSRTEFKPEPRPDDFIVVDMSESIWKMVQLMVGKAKYKFTVDALGVVREPDPFKERMQFWADASYVLQNFWRTLIKKNCHLIAVTGETVLSRTGIVTDDEQTLAMFGPEGVKPSGGRKDGHFFHTVFHVYKDGPKHRITTIKDKFLLQLELPEHREKFLRTDITGQRFYDFYWKKYVEGEP